MKIEKLYTLSQFVDEITNGVLSTIVTKTDNISQTKLYLIYKYNLFLKQSLKKEMFVNPIKQKWDEVDGKKIMVYDSHYNKWQEAEKKVIFVDHLTQCYLKNGLKVDTLRQLAEKGNLELKNVTL